MIAAGLWAAAASAGPPASTASAASGGSRLGAGIELHADESLADIGLPLYPGAVRDPGRPSDPSGYHFGLKLGSFGWRIHVTQWRSDQPIERVAAFYLHELAVFGPVVDCARPRGRRAEAASGAASAAAGKPLECDESDGASHGHIVYKAGARHAYRTVEMRPSAHGTAFELARVEEIDD